MTTDRELLELAARANGFIDDQTSDSAEYGLHRNGQGVYYVTDKNGWHNWEPRDDDGDALRLAVRFNIFYSPMFFHYLSLERFAGQASDDCNAHRRAIVRTVAETQRPIP